MVSEHMNRYEKWQEVYHRTVLEVDGQKMPKSVAAARRAIGQRLQALEDNPARSEERQRIDEALRGLATLELEARSWRHGRLTLVPEQ